AALQHIFFSGAASRIIPSLTVLTGWPGRTCSASQPGAALHGTSFAPVLVTGGRNGIFNSAFYWMRAWLACGGALHVRFAPESRTRRQTGYSRTGSWSDLLKPPVNEQGMKRANGNASIL